jgi:quercetin dioxygenase-like cupin family protein
MIESLQLGLKFDPSRLRDDLAKIADDDWIDHFNTRDYEGAWSGVALRGPANAAHPIQSLVANPGTTDWANTEFLQRCPYFSAVLAAFKCPLLSVRLLRLDPGAVIKEHTDHSLSLEDGEVRLHVPVLTDPRVRFYLNGRRVILGEGETWYLNVNLSHRVTNDSSRPRVHLVADCVVDDWLRSIVDAARRPAEENLACPTTAE